MVIQVKKLFLKKMKLSFYLETFVT